jgi:hypothetical protein
MSEKRAAFAEKFGEDNTARIEAAAADHRDPCAMGDERGKGSDDFRWALLVALSYDCMTKFAESHGFTPEWAAVDAWMKEPAQREWFAAHDGDVDFLGVFLGIYTPYMPEKAEETSEAK